MDFMAIGSTEYADSVKKGPPEHLDQTPVGTGPFRSRLSEVSVIRYKANTDHYSEKPCRRPGVLDHARRHGALRQAQRGRGPRHADQRPADLEETGKYPYLKVIKMPGSKRRLSGLRCDEAAVPQEESSGLVDGDRS